MTTVLVCGVCHARQLGVYGDSCASCGAGPCACANCTAAAAAAATVDQALALAERLAGFTGGPVQVRIGRQTPADIEQSVLRDVTLTARRELDGPKVELDAVRELIASKLGIPTGAVVVEHSDEIEGCIVVRAGGAEVTA